MTSMKIGRYYRYNDTFREEHYVIRLAGVKHQPDGCMYGVSLKYKLYVDPIEGNIGIIYCSRYYWDKCATELTEDEAMVASL